MTFPIIVGWQRNSELGLHGTPPETPKFYFLGEGHMLPSYTIYLHSTELDIFPWWSLWLVVAEFHTFSVPHPYTKGWFSVVSAGKHFSTGTNHCVGIWLPQCYFSIQKLLMEIHTGMADAIFWYRQVLSQTGTWTSGPLTSTTGSHKTTPKKATWI